MAAADLEKITPPKDLSSYDKSVIFDHLFCELANYRNTAGLYAALEASSSDYDDEETVEWKEQFDREINAWGQSLLNKIWVVCNDSEENNCPKLDPFADTATGKIDRLPSPQDMSKILSTILFLDVATSKQYSAHTRTFLSKFGKLDEDIIVSTLRNPDRAIEQAQKQTEGVKADHAERGKTLRIMGVGLGAIAGGVLVGVTGGLAAPLVGAGVTAVLGWFGIGGTILGLLASGLAGSSVICGALFGVYGAKSTAGMVERHTREVRDLAVLPINSKQGDDTLGVRLCVTGWLDSPADVTDPWSVFGGDDTYALQWEIEALEELSNALMTLIRSRAIEYVKGEIVRRTIFATLMSSLAPMALLKIGQIMDNPWMNAKALAVKTGAVLGELLAKRVFGNRPVTLVGYSLGSLVIFEALLYLASLPPSKTIHLIQDIFLFGTPTPAEPSQWTKIRRVVAGRVVNGYASDDYVLAVLSRAADASWSVAGLQAVDVKGVENILCDEVKGHTQWRGMIGRCLQRSDANGIIGREVEEQVNAKE